jgi:hypothetical protein
MDSEKQRNSFLMLLLLQCLMLKINQQTMWQRKAGGHAVIDLYERGFIGEKRRRRSSRPKESLEGEITSQSIQVLIGHTRSNIAGNNSEPHQPKMQSKVFRSMLS